MEKNTQKKVAKLVTFEFTTRVVIDENEMPEVMEEDAYNAAMKKISQENIENIVCLDNMTEVVNDKECPFGTFKEDLNTELFHQLFGLYKMSYNFLNGINEKKINEIFIINEGANILLDNIEELSSIEGQYNNVYEVLTKCVYYVNRDFDHDVNLAEYAEMSCKLVEEISEYLGEFFA